uniref:Uncharacterized protein n=1 Tax=Equus caballus TaxID=9796 RepID=F6S4Z0_HORSE
MSSVPQGKGRMILSLLSGLWRRQPYDGPWSLCEFLSSAFSLKRTAKLTVSVSPLWLHRRRELAKPGIMCSVADWERLGGKTSSAIKLWEVELDIQRDEQRISHYNDHYNTITQICVGDPTKRKTLFQVRSPALSTPSLGNSQA